eukprot:3941571-Rhodomonas_salina.2
MSDTEVGYGARRAMHDVRYDGTGHSGGQYRCRGQEGHPRALSGGPSTFLVAPYARSVQCCTLCQYRVGDP